MRTARLEAEEPPKKKPTKKPPPKKGKAAASADNDDDDAVAAAEKATGSAKFKWKDASLHTPRCDAVAASAEPH